MAPFYNFEEFRRICGEEPSKVFVSEDAVKDAREYFSLNSRIEILNFINEAELKNLEFKNTKPWENNPDKSNEIMVDAYEFRSCAKKGYLAFFFNKKTEKWSVKSFHLSEERFNQFAECFEKIKIGKGENNE